MKISIIIVNHNGMKFLKKMIKTSFNQSVIPADVILVDTSSSDGSIEFVKKYFPLVKIIKVENKGFGYAANEGAKKAEGDFLMFFNEDMYIPRQFIETLVKHRIKLLNKNYNIGAIGCKIIPFNSDHSETKDYFGGKIDLLGFPTDIKNSHEIPFTINGSPFFIEKKLFQKIGGFNPNIFLYGEDEDICWRLNIFGYNNFVCNDTYLYHFGGGAINKNKKKKVANVIASTFIPMLSNYGIVMLCIVIPIYILFIFIINVGILIIYRLDLSCNIELLKVYLKILGKFPSLIKFRNKIQKNRTVGDLQVIKTISTVPSILKNLSYKRL